MSFLLHDGIHTEYGELVLKAVMTFLDSDVLTAEDLKTKLEKQLYLEVQREMDIQKEHEKQVRGKSLLLCSSKYYRVSLPSFQPTLLPGYC